MNLNFSLSAYVVIFPKNGGEKLGILITGLEPVMERLGSESDPIDINCTVLSLNRSQNV